MNANFENELTLACSSGDEPSGHSQVGVYFDVVNIGPNAIELLALEAFAGQNNGPPALLYSCIHGPCSGNETCRDAWKMVSGPVQLEKKTSKRLDFLEPLRIESGAEQGF